MKINTYELFGLIKDGKAPEKIKFNNKIYIYKDITNDYIFVVNGGETREWLSSAFSEYYVGELLKNTVEIIEEDKEIEKIKSNGDEFYSDYIDTWISKNKTNAYCEYLMNKINDLIDEINNLKKEK